MVGAKVRATVAVTMTSGSHWDRTSAHQTGGDWQLITSTLHLWDGVEAAASCLWLQPARHYDDSAAYQYLPQIYLSDSRLWPRHGLSLAPVHPSASEVLRWCSGQKSPSLCTTCPLHHSPSCWREKMAMPFFSLRSSVDVVTWPLQYKSAELQRRFVIVGAL